MSDIVLIVLFNHRYDKNFETIERIYKGRFSNIYHLVPFYDGDKENVIPVFGRSIFFESYIAQGFNSFYKKEYKYYFIVADDMIINPEINENNIQQFFEINSGQSFIPQILPLHKINKFWIGNLSAFFYKRKQKYIETAHELPTPVKALQLIAKQGVIVKPFTRRQLMGKFTFKTDSLGNKARLLVRTFLRMRYPLKKEFPLPYPMVGSYSDIVLISADDIKDFCHYCGVFGATGLFAEVAVPTALVLASKEKIQTEDKMTHKGRSFWQGEGAIFWESEKNNITNLDTMFKDLDDIIKNFPKDCIYLHPIKLSKWLKQ